VLCSTRNATAWGNNRPVVLRSWDRDGAHEMVDISLTYDARQRQRSLMSDTSSLATAAEELLNVLSGGAVHR
jgi:hypothetical protein